jgi:hypothetical protein
MDSVAAINADASNRNKLVNNVDKLTSYINSLCLEDLAKPSMVIVTEFGPLTKGLSKLNCYGDSTISARGAYRTDNIVMLYDANKVKPISKAVQSHIGKYVACIFEDIETNVDDSKLYFDAKHSLDAKLRFETSRNTTLSIGVHLPHKKGKSTAYTKLLKYIEQARDNEEIDRIQVAGDFNMEPHKIKSLLFTDQDSFKVVLEDDCPATTNMGGRKDNIVVSCDTAVTSSQVYDLNTFSHKPIKCTFE